MADYNPLEDTMANAREMLGIRKDAVEQALKPKQRKSNPILDILPKGVTLKGLREAMGE